MSWVVGLGLGLGFLGLAHQGARARERVLKALESSPPYRVSGELVSVVVPTYQEEAYLPKLLTSLENQTYSNLEVIVTDASTDRTASLARERGAKVIKLAERGVSKARNIGAQAASGDTLLFLDADVVAGHQVVERLKAKLDEGYLLVHAAECVVGSGVLNDALMMAINGLKPMWWTSGRCIMVNTDAFWEVDGFREDVEPGEDVDFGRRFMNKFGYKNMAYIGEPIIGHSARRIRVGGYFAKWDAVR